MTDDLLVVVDNEDGTADVVCPCGFEGRVTLYDIGDGPEFCCPSCDMCYPRNPVFVDGKSAGERAGLERLEQYKKEHGWPPSQ